MSGEVVHLISSSFRLILVATATLSVAVFVIGIIQERRRSYWAIGLFLVTKAFIQMVLLNNILEHYYSGARWLQILNFICTWVFAVLLYVMYCYTFSGEFLNIAVASWLGELVTSFLGYFSIGFINLLEGRENIWAMAVEFHPLDLCIPVLDVGLLMILNHFAAPYLRKLRDYKFRHRKLLWSVFVLGVMSATLASFQAYEVIGLSAVISIMECSVLVILLGVLMTKYRRGLQRKQIFLKMQHKIMEMHYEIIQKQIYKMERSQKMIDIQMQEIIKLESGILPQAEAGEKIAAYLAGLRRNFEEIQAGMYCSDWMLDAVLYTQSEMFKKQGIRLECMMQDYQRGKIEEEELVQIFLILLDFGMQANQGQAKKEVRLKAAAIRNQLVIEFMSNCDKGCRLPKRAFSPYIKKYKGTVVLTKEGQGVRLTLALQKG